MFTTDLFTHIYTKYDISTHQQRYPCLNSKITMMITQIDFFCFQYLHSLAFVIISVIFIFNQYWPRVIVILFYQWRSLNFFLAEYSLNLISAESAFNEVTSEKISMTLMIYTKSILYSEVPVGYLTSKYADQEPHVEIL